MHPHNSWRYWAVTGEQLIQSLFRLDSSLCFKHKDGEGSQDRTWGHGWHQVSAKTIVVSFALITQWHPRWARTVDRGKQRGEKKQKTLWGIPTGLCKRDSTCMYEQEHTDGTRIGDYDRETTHTEATTATGSDCLARIWQQLEALQCWDLTCNTNNN